MTTSLSTIGSNATGLVTSQGLGSGLNIASLVSSLVSAEIQPQQTLIQSRQTADQATLSALGTLKSALSSLQSVTDSIATGGALSQLTAQSSSSTVFTASAGSGAVAGSYQVQVQTLAQANTIKSSVFSSASAAVGTGPYSITAGGKTFSVTLDSSNDTLSGLASAINGASANSGVSATIVNATDGAYLLLSATQSGTANAVSVDASAPIGFTSVQDASDATGTIAGLSFKSSSNIVSNVLTGVTLNLAGASATGTTQTLTVSANTQSAANAVQSFVTAYNTALSLIASDTAYTPGTTSGSTTTAGSAGPLQGDVGIASLMQQMESIAGSSLGPASANAFSTLSQIGISFSTTDGTMTLNSTTLNNALQQNPGAVQNLFSGTDGVGKQFDTLISSFAGTSRVIDSKTGALQSQLDAMTNQLTALNSQSAQLTAMYNQEFNAMDSAVAAYKNTSSLLTQLYAPRATNSNTSSGG
ncbi:MAG: flagellar filament capping protein FliD [Nevskia sp.]|nr:flagellar filament capping protein FliD [Nevskia sp.]